MYSPKKLFFQDDGAIPNSALPLLLYRSILEEKGEQAARWLEEKFTSNNWTNSWRWGVYDFHHYHSNTHEVLGVFNGEALILLGGEKGEKVKVKPGDVIVIPAGVGHKCLNHDKSFAVVGAYPNGRSPDLLKGEKGERPKADQNIAQVPIPEADPLLGKDDGLINIWGK
ncbi:cupin domain-containing protein [Cyclobacterium jeungdonense]|uniref:Cupin domain-containing protein n=1 Tax=Cyclobacterium jeungdonense TaxID=708087 RepID=A0ABT8CEK0_9BACT|nr:cupin domain-containing protein [Cyclobacterium jeungdonense]MDN3690492.1 cupin domain-containing protein [Cyclobacterium jeungdonense]